MTIEELISKLRTVPPYLVVRVWDSKHQRFTERFTTEVAKLDDEVLIVPDGEASPPSNRPTSPDLFGFISGPPGC